MGRTAGVHPGERVGEMEPSSIHGHRQPQGLFIQQMPHLALMDTSPADGWVTDSAAGMSAIMTGQKTDNGIISQSAAAVRGEVDGEVLQTILEHAEQRGLSTGVVTNMSIADATPAACYAHANDRSEAGRIETLIHRAGLPVKIPGALDAEKIIGQMRRDKKKQGDHVHFVLLKKIGMPFINGNIEQKMIANIIEEIKS